MNWYPNAFIFPVDKAPFTDERIRKAIHLAVNRQEIVALAAQGAATISGPIPPRLLPNWALSEEELLKLPGFRSDKTQDIAEAKKLLAEAGYPNGITINADATSQSPANNLWPLEVVVPQLAKAGITLKVKMLEWGAFKDTEESRSYDFRSRGTLAFAEPHDQLHVRYHTAGQRNYSKISDPVLDQLIEKQQFTADPSARREIVRQAQMRVLDKAWQIITMNQYIWAVEQPWVMDFPISANADLYRFTWPETVWINK